MSYSSVKDNSYKIYNAKYEDLPHILAIWRHTLEEHEKMEPEHYSCCEDALRVYADILKIAINSSQHYVKVVKSDDNLVVAFLYGYIRSLPQVFKPKLQGYISDISVDKNHQKKGLGQLIFKDFVKWAMLKGATSISLNVHIKNNAAIQFYEKLGLKKQMFIMRASINEIMSEEGFH